MTALKPPARLPQRPRVSIRNRGMFMAVVIRNESVYLGLKADLTPETMTGFPPGFAVLLDCVNAFYDEHHALPGRELIAGAIEETCAGNPSLLNHAEIQEISEFLEMAWDPVNWGEHAPSDDVSTRWALSTGRKILDEGLTFSFRDSVNATDSFAVDVPELLKRMHDRASHIAALSSCESVSAYPEGWDREKVLPVFSTGLPFLDGYMRGGHLAGEVYGILGPFGSCKSTLVYMLAVEAAKAFVVQAQRPDYDGVPALAFVFSYEDVLRDMRLRALGYGARISRSTLETMNEGGMDAVMSTADCLKEYEKAMFHKRLARGDRVAGERERAQEHIDLLSPHLCFKDMTGADDSGAGSGGVGEIRREIARELRVRGARCGLVVVDYVGAAVKRQMAADNVDTDKLRHYVGGFPLAARGSVALSFNCPVWLIHQFNGPANDKSPAVLMHGTDAAECKSWQENLVFNFVAGTLDADSMVGRFGCTKARRARKERDTLIKVEGDMNRVRSADKNYVVDTGQRKIVRRTEFNAFHAAPASASPAAKAATDDDDSEIER